MSEIVLLARLTAHPGRRDELLEAFRLLPPNLLEDEPGTLGARFHTVPDEPDVVVVYERYASAEARAAHRARFEHVPEYIEFFGALEQLLAKPLEAQVLVPLDEMTIARERLAGA